MRARSVLGVLIALALGVLVAYRRSAAYIACTMAVFLVMRMGGIR